MINSIFDNQFWRGSFWPSVEACYSRTWTQYTMLPHFHNRVELMYVLKGTCKIHLLTFNEKQSGTVPRVSKQRIEELGMGDFIFLDAGVAHALEVPGTCYMINAEFAIRESGTPAVTLRSMREASEDFCILLNSGKTIIRGYDQEGSLYPFLSRVVNAFNDTKYDDRLKPALDLALASMLQELARKIRSEENNTSMKYALLAVKLLHTKMQENVKIEDIAQEIGINSSYLQRLFKKEKGCTMIEYLNNIRIEHAKVLLAVTEDPVIDVAMATGYNSRQHFSHVFSRIAGISPQEYRKNVRDCQKKQLFLFANAPDYCVEFEP